MKKLLIALLACIMCFGLVGTCFAEEPDEPAAVSIDLDALTTDELIALKSEITKLIIERIGLGSIGIGDYVVGRDIKAGAYEVECTQESSGHYDLYETVADYENDAETIGSSNIWVGDKITVNLKDGMVFCVQGFSGTIAPATDDIWVK